MVAHYIYTTLGAGYTAQTICCLHKPSIMKMLERQAKASLC